MPTYLQVVVAELLNLKSIIMIMKHMNMKRGTIMSMKDMTMNTKETSMKDMTMNTKETSMKDTNMGMKLPPAYIPMKSFSKKN